MDDQQLRFLYFLLGLFCVFGIIVGLLAMRKGFGFMSWFFSGGLVIFALIALAFFSSARDPKLTEEEKQQLTKKGNFCGQIISAICLGIGAIRFFK